jgi:hypothetical protein
MLWSLLKFTECVVGGPRRSGREEQETSIMLKKIGHLAAVAALVLGIGAASFGDPAAAGRGGAVAAGVAVGTVLGLGIAGAYAGPRYYAVGPGCYRGPRQCDYVGRSCWYNRFGEYICRGGDYRCWRPTICD